MSPVRASADGWLRCYRPRPDARVRLVCLPHAGGNAAFYRPWTDLLPPTVELAAVQYPGRLDRMTEPPVPDMPTMVRTLTAVLLADSRLPLAIFGHSMGAAIAFEVVSRLERQHGVEPVRVVLSGRQPPEHHRSETVDVEDDDALWAEVRRLGGTTDDSLDSDAIRAFALPGVRADYRLIDSYAPVRRPPIATPITALVGDADPEVSVAEAGDWRRHSTGGFELRVFSGDHFYLVARRTAVISDVVRALGEPAVTRAPGALR